MTAMMVRQWSGLYEWKQKRKRQKKKQREKENIWDLPSQRLTYEFLDLSGVFFNKYTITKETSKPAISVHPAK